MSKIGLGSSAWEFGNLGFGHDPLKALGCMKTNAEPEKERTGCGFG